MWLSVLGGLFSIAKADWGTRKLLVIPSREVVAPDRLLYIDSFNPDLRINFF